MASTDIVALFEIYKTFGSFKVYDLKVNLFPYNFYDFPIMRTTLVGMLQTKCTYVEVKNFKRQNRNSAINYHTEKKRRRSKLKKI